MQAITQAIQAHRDNHVLKCKGMDMDRCGHTQKIRELKAIQLDRDLQEIRLRQRLVTEITNKKQQVINLHSPTKSEFTVHIESIFDMAIKFLGVGE
jgi:hypothetical protein